MFVFMKKAYYVDYQLKGYFPFILYTQVNYSILGKFSKSNLGEDFMKSKKKIKGNMFEEG